MRESPTTVVPGNRLRWPLVAVPLVAVSVLALAAALLRGRLGWVPAGLPDAGALTWWALPAARVAFDLAAVGTLGTLLAAAVLVPAETGRLSPLARGLLRRAGWWAAAWCAAALSGWWLLLSSIVGVPLTDVLSSGAVGDFGWSVGAARSALLAALVAALVAGLARCVRSVATARWVLVLAASGLLAGLLTGHASGSAALALHVVGVSLWTGGLLAIVLYLRGGGVVLRSALPRFSSLALGCFLVVGLSGLLTAYARLGLSREAWTSTYGRAVLAKAVVLLVLGVVGWLHRSVTVTQVLAGRPRTFLRLAIAELLLMGSAVGLAVALSRTAPPLTSRGTHDGARALLGYDVVPLSLRSLLTAWQPDALVLSAAALATVGYLAAVRRAGRGGSPWPLGRTLSVLAGLAVAVVALCGGPAAYSRALVSVQVGQLLVLLLVVPILLSLGQPIRLAQRARATAGDPGPVVRLLADPVNGLLFVVGLVVVLYASPLLESSLRSASAHLLVNLLALTVGCLFWWALLERDRVPQPRPGRDRFLLVGVLLALLLAFGWGVRTAGAPLGGSWFTELDWPWSDPMADQRAGAVVVWVSVLWCVVLVLLAQLADGLTGRANSYAPRLARTRRRTRPRGRPRRSAYPTSATTSATPEPPRGQPAATSLGQCTPSHTWDQPTARASPAAEHHTTARPRRDLR